MDKQLRQSRQPSNNHDYLNFVKKHPKIMQYQRNRLMYPPPLEINRKSSVFALKDSKREYCLEKLASSINTPVYHLEARNNGRADLAISQQVVHEIVERKYKEIQQEMTKERQSMSEIIYNYSKYKSMESQYYRTDKNRKKADKVVKKEELVKFPLVNKQPNQIFTIDYDPDGKKMIKINLEPDIAQLKKKSQSLLNDNNTSAKEYRELSHEKAQMTKRDKALFKRKKLESQFGIEIKSINSKILENLSDYQNGLKLRRELFELATEPGAKTNEKAIELKRQEENQAAKQRRNLERQQSNKSLYNNEASCNFKEVFVSNVFPKPKAKYSSSSLSHRQYQEAQNADNTVKGQEQKQSKRQNYKKNHVILYEKEVTVYDQKISSYRQFLFMLNMAHKKYDAIMLKDYASLRNEEKYRVYVGPGNNSLLVKSLIKRRFWWVLEEDYKKAHFSWTQLKINALYQQQPKSYTKDIDSKIQSQGDSPKSKRLLKKEDSKSPNKAALFKPPLPADRDKIFTAVDRKIYEHLEQSVSSQSIDKLARFANKLKTLEISSFTPTSESKASEKMHNHLQFNHFIGNKKALFYNLKKYYELLKKNVFEIIPLTFHIKDGQKDPEYSSFLKEYRRIENLRQLARKKRDKQQDKHKDKQQDKHKDKQQGKKEKDQGKKKEKDQGKKKDKEQKCKKIRNVWIVKPGQLSNRGNGIVVINEVYELNNILKKKEKHSEGAEKTYIVQKYIESPLLYKGRKFDIRHYMIITRLHGIMRAYWYGQGYIRTSSFDFDLEDVGDEMVHLTNDAIQKNSTFYGRHEEGNKLSYADFQKYLDQKYQDRKLSFAEHIYPQMKAIATDALRATYLQLDSNRLQHNFQVFGLDFMIDDNFDVWLIEVNTNPCLEISSKLLGRVIPNMLEQAFRLSIDVVFPPPTNYPNSQKYMTPDNAMGRLMYELIFDEARDGRELAELYRNSSLIDYGEVMEDQEVYENQGRQIDLSPDIS